MPRMELTLEEVILMLRHRAGMSQDDVGKKTGLGRNAIGRIEAGEVSPKIDQLKAIADALNAKLTVRMEAAVE